MNKNTKITLDELLRRKEQLLEAKKKPKRATVYVKSLDGDIVIQAPTKAMATEAVDMGDDADVHMVYECVVEPNLRSDKLQKEFECSYPEEIVTKIFASGEISPIAMECMKLAGYVDSVKFVDEIKN